MGDQTELPDVSKYNSVVINEGIVTAAQVILGSWKSPSPPDLKRKKQRKSMLEIVSYEHMLARVSDEGESFMKSWARFFVCHGFAKMQWFDF